MSRVTPEQRSERRQAMAERLAIKREQMQEKLAQQRENRSGGGDPDRRNRWLLLLLLALVLLLLFRQCQPAPTPEIVAQDPCPAGPVADPVVPEPAIAPGRIDRRDRPEFQPPTAKSPTWIDAFRMQVAARSPRLGACFVGAGRPGRMKWTTSVEPVKGLVSAHELEPMLLSGDLTRQQRNCVLDVLSDPTYTLRPDDEPSTPSRVGLVIEF